MTEIQEGRQIAILERLESRQAKLEDIATNHGNRLTTLETITKWSAKGIAGLGVLAVIVIAFLTYVEKILNNI